MRNQHVRTLLMLLVCLVFLPLMLSAQGYVPVAYLDAYRLIVAGIEVLLFGAVIASAFR